MKLKKYMLCIAAVLSAGCTADKENIVFEPSMAVYSVAPYQEDMIALQNLYSRVLVYCYSSADFTAEQCARGFEAEGYVRLREIPKLTAEYDFLKGNTYPTRRWRDDDLVPRW